MITSTHIKKAQKTARYANVKRAKVAAIAISHSGEIIASAHNRRVEGDPDKWTEHAEEVLLAKLVKLKAFDRYDKIKIFVLRVTNKGFGMAKPCRRCRAQLDNYDVQVYYTRDEHLIGALK